MVPSVTRARGILWVRGPENAQLPPRPALRPAAGSYPASLSGKDPVPRACAFLSLSCLAYQLVVGMVGYNQVIKITIFWKAESHEQVFHVSGVSLFLLLIQTRSKSLLGCVDFKSFSFWSSRCGTAEMNPTRNHEDAGSIPGLAQWVKNPLLP